ncbi:MAG: hypothetical protein ISP90_09930 [Nevskia sp.]|nr:hypothetical protein [Nevskia sp.]
MKFRLLATAGLMLAAQFPVHAADPATALPAMNFYSSIATDELFDAIKANPAFSRLDKQLYGSPITLRVTHSLRPTAAGQATGFISALWAGSTLGLLPVVTNNSLAITYEVLVHNKTVTTRTYQRTFTRAISMWSKDATYGLGHDGLDWAKSTAGEFATEALSDPKLIELNQEYLRYFGGDTAGSAPAASGVSEQLK